MSVTYATLPVRNSTSARPARRERLARSATVIESQLIEGPFGDIVDHEVVKERIVLDFPLCHRKAASQRLLGLTRPPPEPLLELGHRWGQHKHGDGVRTLDLDLARALVVNVEDHPAHPGSVLARSISARAVPYMLP